MKLFKTKDEKKTALLIKTVQTMRENAEDMRMWKNVPLAEECIQLLHEISDEAEPPMGKALACEAIIGLLPEYDVPRLVLSILRYKQALIQLSEEQDPSKYPTEEEVQHDILRLEDYIDTERVPYSTFKERYDRHLEFDPIERSHEWEDSFLEVERECDRRLGDTPRGMGFCFAYWSTRRAVLAERGIEWHSPSQLNPRVHFD